MYYRGPGILVVYKLNLRHTGRPRNTRTRDNLLKGKKGGGAKSYDVEKACSSIIH